MLVLTVISGPDKGKRFDIDEPQLIGRSSEALRTRDNSISRRHAELTPDNGRWYIRDLGSSNGTFVNGKKITGRTQIRPGDHILTGSTLFLCGQEETESDARKLIELLKPEQIKVEISATAATGEESTPMFSGDDAAAAMEQLKVLYRLTQITTQVYDRQSLLEKVLDLLFDVFQPDRGFVLLLDAENDETLPAAVRRRDNGNQTSRVAVALELVRETIRKKVGILARTYLLKQADVSSTKNGKKKQKKTIPASQPRSVLCVPIQFRNHVFGVLYINAREKRKKYDEAQLNLLTAVGQHTGLALQNAEMYQSQLRNERLAAVGETVASLSHSIKNILQGLRGGADVLAMGLKKEDLQLARGGWDVLGRNLERVYRLTMNMLAFTKQSPLELELTKLKPLLEDCETLLRDQCKRKGVQLILDLDPDMPPIPVDPNALHQAIMNLLINAFQAVDAKTGVISLRTEYIPSRRAGSTTTPALARIIVTDNGPGISPQQLNRIFEAFFSTKGIRGTGLGLAVTKKVIEEHHGTIHASSSPGEGATFVIALPAVAQGMDPADTTAPHAGSENIISDI